jgi:hypothetical protein
MHYLFDVWYPIGENNYCLYLLYYQCMKSHTTSSGEECYTFENVVLMTGTLTEVGCTCVTNEVF